jgi:hypothetical protein
VGFSQYRKSLLQELHTWWKTFVVPIRDPGFR